MTLNRTNIILIGLLAVQIILTLLIALPDGSGDPIETGGALLGEFTDATVTQITIRNFNGEELVFAQDSSGAWVYPAGGNYPARADRIAQLLTGAANLRANRLISENASSHNRLSVADDNFERYVEFAYAGGGEPTGLYLGASSGGSDSYTRVSGQDEVYLTSGLSSADVTATITTWIDVTYLSVDQEQVTRIVITNENGTFEFNRSGETWTFAGLAEGETFDDASISNLLFNVSAIRMSAPVGTEESPDYGLDDPLATVQITVEIPPEVSPEAVAGLTPEATEALGLGVDLGAGTEGGAEPTIETYTFEIGAEIPDSREYYAKASTSEYYVRIAQSTANLFLSITRDRYVISEATPEATVEATASSEATGEATPGAEATEDVETTPAAEASTPEAEPTPEAEATAESTAAN
jgi:hypothetical protein